MVLLTSTERSCPIRCLWEHSRPSLSNHLLFLPWVLEWLFWTEVAPLSLLPNQVKSSLASELLFKTFSEWWKEVLCCWMPISCLGQRLQFSFSLFLNKKKSCFAQKGVSSVLCQPACCSFWRRHHLPVFFPPTQFHSLYIFLSNLYVVALITEWASQPSSPRFPPLNSAPLDSPWYTSWGA